MTQKGRYKFHYYVGDPPVLFDLKNDPEELNDLVGDLRFAETPRDMEAALRTLLDPEEVAAAAKAAQAAIINRHGGPEKAKNVGTPGTTPVPGYGHN